jgi:hypothetical protein
MKGEKSVADVRRSGRSSKGCMSTTEGSVRQKGYNPRSQGSTARSGGHWAGAAYKAREGGVLGEKVSHVPPH